MDIKQRHRKKNKVNDAENFETPVGAYQNLRQHQKNRDPNAVGPHEADIFGTFVAPNRQDERDVKERQNKTDNRPQIKKEWFHRRINLAEGVRFELTVPEGTPVFKTGPFSLFGTPP